MIAVPVELGARRYEVRIGGGLLTQTGAMIAPLTANRRVVVVTDAQVAPLWLDALGGGFASAGLDLHAIVLPPGEATKNWRTLESVVEQLLALGVERGDVVVALGGGVIGDLTGFACAVLRRGCRFVQVPTTLLAQVDSSVGGKTAINAAAGKNLVGAFHQPSLVVIDPDVLATLPDRELRAGYAEVVKYGLIGDAAFFDWCEANVAALLARDPAALAHAISVSVAAKAATVAADEHETSGIRALLNLGHTFGHALEAEAGFSDRLLHGEAVATGMELAFDFSANEGLCSAADAARVRTHLHAAGLPVDPLPADPADLILHMRQDKKMAAGNLAFILARGIGQAFVAKHVSLAAVETFLGARLAALGNKA